MPSDGVYAIALTHALFDIIPMSTKNQCLLTFVQEFQASLREPLSIIRFTAQEMMDSKGSRKLEK